MNWQSLQKILVIWSLSGADKERGKTLVAISVHDFWRSVSNRVHFHYWVNHKVFDIFECNWFFCCKITTVTKLHKKLICISNSSQGSTPLVGMRCWLNIPGHPIIASKNVIMLPSNEMEKTATSDDYNSNHFQDATLLCSLIFQKQESREMSHTNLTGLIRKT